LVLADNAAGASFDSSIAQSASNAASPRREFLVAPIPRGTIPLANAAAVLTIAGGQFALIVLLALLRGAHLQTSPARLLAAVVAAALLSLGAYALAEVLVYRIRQP
jgi:hypothetical protein